MIVCLYGRPFAPLIEPTALDLCATARELGGELIPLSIERAVADRIEDRSRWARVRRVYILPFDVPPRLPPAAPTTPAGVVRWLFPGAEVLNAFDVQETCWDKPSVSERWLSRGVPVPECLLTGSSEDASAFVQQHEWTILKAPRSCGGHGDYIVTSAADGLVAEARGQRYELDLVPGGSPPRIVDRRLRYPGPFYLQRLVADTGLRGVLRPAQHLRAYIVDGQIVFWTERYREHYRCWSDWIVGTGLGARYRFLFSVGEEARKIALRAAEVIDLRIGVVDLVRTASAGVYALAALSDGHHMMIDREFKRIPEFRDCFDLDRFIAEALVAEPVSAATLQRP